MRDARMRMRSALPTPDDDGVAEVHTNHRLPPGPDETKAAGRTTCMEKEERTVGRRRRPRCPGAPHVDRRIRGDINVEPTSLVARAKHDGRCRHCDESRHAVNEAKAILGTATASESFV